MKAFAGIDLGGTHIKYGLVNSDGRVLAFKKIPANAEQGGREILKKLEKCGQELLDLAAKKRLSLDYIGIGSPGAVDSKRGQIQGHSPNIPGWKGTKVTSHLAKALDFPVYIGNDANLMALAEMMFGSARGYRNAIFTTVGTGIGGAVMIDGKLVLGKSFNAGEFGHVPIIKDGRRCACGLKGCLESYASAPNLLQIAIKLAKNPQAKGTLARHYKMVNTLTIRQLLRYFKEKDEIAIEAVTRQADYMASGFAAVINLLDLEAVIIGGGVADGGGAAYIRLIESLLKKRILPDSTRGLKVKKARLGNKAGLIGAAFQKESPAQRGSS